MALQPYKTKGGLTLLPPQKDEDGSFVLVLRGDRDKGYFRGNLAAATVAFKKEVEHYKEAEA
jgi:hypothetical protein